MILDDHEIEDNWTQDRIEKKRFLFNLAIGSYCSYQWSHSPRNFGSRLYYSFECEGYPFFVLDGRTDRYKDDDDDSLVDNHLLGRPSFAGDDLSQLEIFLGWLEAQQDKIGDAPKFVVSASVFVPNNVGTTKTNADKRKRKLKESDSWPAFPTTREAVLQKIVDRGIQNVVFLSGDIHCSNVAEMRFSGEASHLKAFSVTSSALYWPFFFADGEPSNYVHDSKDAKTPDTFTVTDAVEMDYRAKGFTQEDNFCRLKVDRATHKLVIEVFGKDGEPVKKKNRRLRTEFTLAEW
jgi:alkaline phosphatase D